MEEFDLHHIATRSVKGIVALVSRTSIHNIISFVTFLIISAILLPYDLGIFTAVTAIQRIISFFTDFGFGAALIQKKDELTKNDLITSFTLQSGITLFIFLIVFASKDFLALYFHLQTDAVALLLSLVFCIFLSSFKTIPSILLERKIHFEKLVIPQIVESLSFNIILVILILFGYKLQSFTYAFLVSGLLGIPVYYFVSPWPISIGIDKKSLHHLKFGFQFQAKSILATIKDDFLTIFLIKVLSYTEIGYIGFGQRIAFFVFRYVVDNVTRVTFSTYSRIQTDTIALKKAIEKSLFFVSSITFPVLGGVIVTIPYVIQYFPKWHNKYEPAIISLVFFCLNAMVSSLSGILVNVLDATGKVRITLHLMIGWVILTWILTPIFIYLYGYNGVSVASFLVTTTIGITIYLVKKLVDFNFFQSIAKPLVCTILMSTAVYILTIFIVKDFVTLLATVIIGGILYIGMFYGMAKEEIHSGIRLLKQT